MLYPEGKKVIGITGGMGSGKSTVTKIFESRGAIPIYADNLAKYYTSKESPIKEELIELFGKKVLLESGEVDRKEISFQIFQNKEKLEKLTGLIHPKVRMETRKRISDAPNGSIIAWEVPLLFETGGEEICTHTVCIYIPEDLAIERVRIRDGISEKEYRNRMQFQMDIHEKFKKAEFKIENSGSLQDLEKKSLDLYYIIRRGA